MPSVSSRGGRFARGLPVVVDTSGPALAAALAASPTLVKPNLDELPDVTDVADPFAAARRLSLESGAAVAVTRGAAGMVLAVGDEAWHGSLDQVLRGNPTGAGDAALAAFARGLADGCALARGAGRRGRAVGGGGAGAVRRGVRRRPTTSSWRSGSWSIAWGCGR